MFFFLSGRNRPLQYLIVTAGNILSYIFLEFQSLSPLAGCEDSDFTLLDQSAKKDRRSPFVCLNVRGNRSALFPGVQHIDLTYVLRFIIVLKFLGLMFLKKEDIP